MTRAVGVNNLSTAAFYSAAAGALPGASTFTASVLFRAACPGTAITRRSLFANVNAANATGWKIFLDPDGVVGCGVSETGPAFEVVDTVYNLGPSDIMLVTMVVSESGTLLKMFVNGQQSDEQETDIATPLPSALSATIGCARSGGSDAPAEGATDAIVLGAMYDGVNAWTGSQCFQHWLAVQATGRMCDGAFGNVGYAMPEATNLYDCWTNNGGRGSPPAVALATWADVKGAADMTRTGAPTILGFVY